jgi:hypothetical protein
MVRMFIRHGVRDYGKWRRAYNSFDRERRGMGVTRHAVFRAAGRPNDVTVTHDFATLTKARSFAKSKRLREVMKGAGVRTVPQVWFAKPA